jgi:hypothetical protein
MDAPPPQYGTKTPRLTGTSDALRRFDQDSRLVAIVVLSLIFVAAIVVACM